MASAVGAFLAQNASWLVPTALGAVAQGQASQRAEQGQQAALDATRAAEADFRRRTAPIEEFYQSILAPGFQAVDPTLQASLSGQVKTAVEEAVERAQERVRADAIRRGIYRSGVTGEALRDVEERGLEQIARSETDIAQQAAALTQQQQQAASQGLRNLAAMQDPAMNRAALEEQFAQSAAQPWQDFAGRLFEPAADKLLNTILNIGKQDTLGKGDIWSGASFGTPGPTQSAFRLPGVNGRNIWS